MIFPSFVRLVSKFVPTLFELYANVHADLASLPVPPVLIKSFFFNTNVIYRLFFSFCKTFCEIIEIWPCLVVVHLHE